MSKKTIESTFVSSVGEYVNLFEEQLSKYLNIPKSVGVVNGTSALQVALRLVGVNSGDEVLTQSLSFVATANAIEHNHANPVFLDVDMDTLSLSPTALTNYLETYAEQRADGFTYNKTNQKRISACIPMHTFGFIGRINEVILICKEYNIAVVEDAAEALGSWCDLGAAGTLGQVGALSFNGNKIITSGGGGAIISRSLSLLDQAKHLTTTAKIPHPWEYDHDEIGYNYRMPNLNSALALGQMENLQRILDAKHALNQSYCELLSSMDQSLLPIPETTQKWNHWLFGLKLDSREERDNFLAETNKKGVMTRPIWKLLHELKPYRSCSRDDQTNAYYLSDRIVNIPSTPMIQ